MEGMLSPDFKEEITGLCEIRDTFKISKIGTIAGCMVTKGKIVRNSEIRLIREGVVIYTGVLSWAYLSEKNYSLIIRLYLCNPSGSFDMTSLLIFTSPSSG